MEEPIQKDDFGVPGVPPIFGHPIGDRKSMKILKMFTVLSFFMSFFFRKIWTHHGSSIGRWPWTQHFSPPPEPSPLPRSERNGWGPHRVTPKEIEICGGRGFLPVFVFLAHLSSPRGKKKKAKLSTCWKHVPKVERWFPSQLDDGGRYWMIR